MHQGPQWPLIVQPGGVVVHLLEGLAGEDGLAQAPAHVVGQARVGYEDAAEVDVVRP